MLQIPQNKHLEPYFKIAQEEAKKSPCTRRKYGALIKDISSEIVDWTATYNVRVTTCCNNRCIRDTMDFTNGENVEYGAEVHAETAALIAHDLTKDTDRVMVLVGYKGERELLGSDVWPCRVCALNIKYAGFRYIYVKNYSNVIIPASIDEIIAYREEEWEPDK